MNNISEHSNGVINTKARALIADSEVDDNLCPEAVTTSAYLANQTEKSTKKGVSFEVFLHQYNGDDNDYT